MKKYVLFDLWDSALVYDFDDTKANKMVLSHTLKNPKNLQVEDLNKIYKQVFDELRKSKGEKEFTYYEIQRKMKKEYGLRYDIPLLEMEYKFISTGHSLSLPKNIKEFIKYLKKNDYHIGIVSNTISHVTTLNKILTKAYGTNPFEFIVASSVVGYRKPSKIIFDKAIKKCNVDPSNIYFIGDNYECDVKGAYNAKMIPLHYNFKRKPRRDEFNYYEFSDYKELLEYFKKIKED